VLTLGVLQASTLGNAEYLYFEKYRSESGPQGRVNTHLEFPVTRFSPDVTVTWAHIRERSTNEFDTRAPRTDFGYTAGLQTKLTSRISMTASLGRQKTVYDKGFIFRGVDLSDQLDRNTVGGVVSTTVTVTPFTHLVADAGVSRDEFLTQGDKTTDNIRVNAGVEFAADAVISGRASVGYHSLKPHRDVPTTTMQAFEGITSNTDLSYTLLGVTRFSGRFSRDSNYSVSADQPLYVSTAGGLNILQALFGPVDVDVHGNRERLEYEATAFESARTDFADTVGGGLSIRVAPQMVAALMYDNYERRSTAGSRFEYKRRRIYTTITYGF
jgi:opacity protein-like surface antigen